MTPYYNVINIFGEPSIMIVLKNVSICNHKKIIGKPQFVNHWDIALNA